MLRPPSPCNELSFYEYSIFKMIYDPGQNAWAMHGPSDNKHTLPLNVVMSANRTMRANIERGLGAGPNEMAGIVGFKGIIF